MVLFYHKEMAFECNEIKKFHQMKIVVSKVYFKSCCIVFR